MSIGRESLAGGSRTPNALSRARFVAWGHIRLTTARKCRGNDSNVRSPKASALQADVVVRLNYLGKRAPGENCTRSLRVGDASFTFMNFGCVSNGERRSRTLHREVRVAGFGTACRPRSATLHQSSIEDLNLGSPPSEGGDHSGLVQCSREPSAGFEPAASPLPREYTSACALTAKRGRLESNQHARDLEAQPSP